MAGLGCEGLTWPQASVTGCEGSARSLPPSRREPGFHQHAISVNFYD